MTPSLKLCESLDDEVTWVIHREVYRLKPRPQGPPKIFYLAKKRVELIEVLPGEELTYGRETVDHF